MKGKTVLEVRPTSPEVVAAWRWLAHRREQRFLRQFREFVAVQRMRESVADEPADAPELDEFWTEYRKAKLLTTTRPTDAFRSKG